MKNPLLGCAQVCALLICGAVSAAAQCINPPTKAGNGFQPGELVTYQFVGGNWGPEQNAVVEAMEKWTAANSGRSNVRFAHVGGGQPPLITLVKTPLPPNVGGGITEPSRNQAGYIIGLGMQFTTNTAVLESPSGFLKVALHELGHAQNLDDAHGTGGTSVMNQMANKDDTGGNIPMDVTACDASSAEAEAPEPSTGGGGGGPLDQGGEDCGGAPCTPVIVPLTSGHMLLTGPEVLFDLGGGGTVRYWGWTRAAAGAGFLALDRNGNGMVDDGRELFGNMTPLSWTLDGPRASNGFLALAWFDQIENGGNGDGRCSAEDSVYQFLRVWVDENHDGISGAGELFSLGAVGLTAIELTIREMVRYDQHGNEYRWRVRVILNGRPRWAYDVILVSGLP